MDLTKDALEFLTAKRPPSLETIEDRQYSDMELHPIKTPLSSSVGVCTLNGFLGLIDNAIEDFKPEEVLIHVRSFSEVGLIAKVSDDWAQRKQLAVAKPLEMQGFRFGQFMDHESFVIGLQAGFVSTPDLVALIKVASNLTAERVQTSEDDGISQKVGQRRGVVLKGTDTIPGRVKLSPFRTFPEVDQPISEFAFRVRQKSGDAESLPELGLFEADGGAWKLDAMATVKDYLAKNLKKTIPIVA